MGTSKKIYQITKESFTLKKQFLIGEKILNTWSIEKRDGTKKILLLNSDYYFYIFDE